MKILDWIISLFRDNNMEENEELSPSFSEDDATNNYTHYKNEDPFPNISSALLNSADIVDYVEKVGMIYPFYNDDTYLKSASYAARLLGKIIWWEDNKKYERIIQVDEEFTLKQNSIYFVSIEPYFRLPEYIALRFNLTIKMVHRGILLGTGPLIDPGFVGKIMIPLHNLTNNDYLLKGGEPLIWIEFTKVSNNNSWASGTETIEGDVNNYRQFPDEKSKLNFDEMILKALRGQTATTITSSLSSYAKDASELRILNDSIKTRLKTFSIIGIISVIIAIGGILTSATFQNISVNKYIRDSEESISSLNQEYQNITNEINSKIERLEIIISELENSQEQVNGDEGRNIIELQSKIEEFELKLQQLSIKDRKDNSKDTKDK